MQVRRPVCSMADVRGSLVVMKTFNRKELNFTGEGEAGNKCMYPVSVTRFA
jgi:hypothetical protein